MTDKERIATLKTALDAALDICEESLELASDYAGLVNRKDSTQAQEMGVLNHRHNRLFREVKQLRGYLANLEDVLKEVQK